MRIITNLGDPVLNDESDLEGTVLETPSEQTTDEVDLVVDDRHVIDR